MNVLFKTTNTRLPAAAVPTTALPAAALPPSALPHDTAPVCYALPHILVVLVSWMVHQTEILEA